MNEQVVFNPSVARTDHETASDKLGFGVVTDFCLSLFFSFFPSSSYDFPFHPSLFVRGSDLPLFVFLILKSRCSSCRGNIVQHRLLSFTSLPPENRETREKLRDYFGVSEA